MGSNFRFWSFDFRWSDQAEKFAYRQGIKFRQGAAAPFPAERLGLKARAAAIGTGIIGPIAGKEDTHVHLVGLRFKITKKSLQAVPALRPGPAVFAIAGFAFDDIGFLLRRQLGERNIDGNFSLFGEGQQIAFRFTVDLAFPGLDRALLDRERLVRNG